MKKTVMIAVIALGVLLLAAGSVFAAGQIAHSSAISAEAARNFAYIDAGILPEQAAAVKTEFEYEKGKFVYEIEFVAAGAKYEYTIDPMSGLVLAREYALLPDFAAAPGTLPAAEQAKEDIAYESTEPKDNTSGDKQDKTSAEHHVVQVIPPQSAAEPPVVRVTPAQPPTQSQTQTEPQQTAPQQGFITVEEAKEIALRQAGLAAEDVSFSKAKLERENGVMIYDIEFYVMGEAEYEYEIDAVSGAVLDADFEPWDENDDDDDDDDD